MNEKEQRQEINRALKEYLKYKGLSKKDRKQCIHILHDMIDQYDDIKVQLEANNDESLEEEMDIIFCYGCKYMSYDQPAGFTAEPRFHCSLHDLETSPLGMCSWGIPAGEEEEIPYIPKEKIIADISLNHCCNQDLRYWY